MGEKKYLDSGETSSFKDSFNSFQKDFSDRTGYCVSDRFEIKLLEKVQFDVQDKNHLIE